MAFFRRALSGALLTLWALLTAKAGLASPGDDGGKMSDRNTKLDALLANFMPVIKAHWKACREAGLEGMSPAVTDKVDSAIISYFKNLKALREPAADDEILGEMKKLYKKLDDLNSATDYGLLETDERELLVPIFIEAAEICGIDSAKYDGEPGGEFRDF